MQQHESPSPGACHVASYLICIWKSDPSKWAQNEWEHLLIVSGGWGQKIEKMLLLMPGVGDSRWSQVITSCLSSGDPECLTNPSNNCGDISLWTKVLDLKPDWRHPLYSQKVSRNNMKHHSGSQYYRLLSKLVSSESCCFIQIVLISGCRFCHHLLWFKTCRRTYWELFILTGDCN